MENELSVRARRIDDLPSLNGESDGNDEAFKYTLGDGDSFLVSHQTNRNDESGAYVLFSRKLQAQELNKFVANYIKNELTKEGGWLKEISLSDLADGEKFMEDITKTLEDMKSKEVNSLMQNSYHRQKDLELRRELNENGITAIVSDEHTFMQDTNAYVHIAVNLESIQVTTDMLDFLTLQVNTNDGWMDICSEPLTKITKTTPTEIDFHGFFYAGTKIRTNSKALGQKSSFNDKYSITGYMQVLETSNVKPFPKESFTWRVGIPSNTKGDQAQNITQSNSIAISADGFIRASGNFLNDNAASTTKKNSSNRYMDQQSWATPFVYLAQKINEGNNPSCYKQIGNGNSVVMVPGKTPINDDFCGRYFYIQKESADPNSQISVLAFSDQRMNDKSGKSSIAGIKNPVTLNYIKYDELPIYMPEFGEDLQQSYSQISSISALFNDTIVKGIVTKQPCHKFIYGRILGRPSGTSVTAFNQLNTSEFGTQRKSLACIGVASDGPNFIRGSKIEDENNRNWTYSLGEPTEDSKYFFTVVKKLSDNESINFDGNGAPLLRDFVDKEFTDTTTTKNLNPSLENESKWSSKYEYDVLSTNLRRIGCFPKKITTYSAKQSDGTVDYVAKYLSYNDMTSPLISVNFSKDCCKGLTIDDSAFAFCSFLSDITIPEGMFMNGNATFYMGYSDKNPTCQAVKVTKGVYSISPLSYAPQLRTVTFLSVGDGYVPNPIHIENDVLAYTFSMCKSLVSANIQYTDAKSLSGTFRFCENLSSLTFPPTLMSIGKTTFEGCTHLSNIFFDVNLSSLEKDALKGLPANLTADNTYSSKEDAGGKYRLGINYNLGVMLSGDSTLTGENGYYEDTEDTNEKILKKGKVWGEIEPVAKLMTGSSFMYSTTANQSRRFYICDKNGTKLKMKTTDKNTNDNYAVFSPFITNTKGEKTSVLIKNWNDNFKADNIMSYADSDGIIKC